MCGYGSGQWYRYSSKSTTDASKRLDIRFLKKNGWLFTGRIGTLSWSIGDTPCGSIGYSVHNDRLVLNYKYTPHDQDESESIKRNIYFEKTSCNYGGERTWFICPHCGKRREVLYLYGRNFTCRTCANLNYECQHEQPLDRHYRQARKIRRKLIPEIDPDFNPDNLSDPVLFKPKGMHQKTFDKLRYKQAIKIDRAMGYLVKIAGINLDRLDL